MIKKIITTCMGLLLGLALFGVGLIAIAILVTYPKLPSLDSLQHYKPKMPLTIYSSDGQVIGVYGEQRREFTKIGDFPKILKDAVIAAEDKRFYDHWGVDVWGVARAAIGNVMAGGVQSGASTITQQVAKNFYLSSERSFTRKFNEALLAYKIEQSLSKDKILELYFNQIYLGQRAYGFASAAQIYFNKNVNELTLAEAAMLAGLPKAPSAYNPIVNPERAKLRQTYILNNMLEEGMITLQQRDQALKEELHYERLYKTSIKVPCTLPKWYVKSCLRNTAKMPTLKALRYIPLSTLHTSAWPPKPCVKSCAILTAAAATAVQKTTLT